MVAMVDEAATGLWLAESSSEQQGPLAARAPDSAAPAPTELPEQRVAMAVAVAQAETVVQEAALQELVAMAATVEIASDASSD